MPPNTKISADPNYVTPLASDVLPIVDITAVLNKKITVSNLASAILATINATAATFTNKRNVKRVLTIVQSATPAINTDLGDIFQITGLAQAITSMTTNLMGTPLAGEMMEIQFTDNATPRAITWGASFASTTVTLPTTTVASAMLRVLFQRNNANTAWDCIAVA